LTASVRKQTKCKHTLYSYSTAWKCSETSHNKRLQGTQGMWPTSPQEENLLLELNKESVFPCARTFYSEKFYPVNFLQWKFTLKLVLVKDLKQEGERCLYLSPPYRQQKLLPSHQPPDYNWHSTQEEHVLCASNNNEQFHVPVSTVQCDSLEWSYTISCTRAVGKSILEPCSVRTISSQWGTTSPWQTVFQSLLQCFFVGGLLLRANVDHSCISINSYIPHVGNNREYPKQLDDYTAFRDTCLIIWITTRLTEDVYSAEHVFFVELWFQTFLPQTLTDNFAIHEETCSVFI